jgi:hypothetical protein
MKCRRAALIAANVESSRSMVISILIFVEIIFVSFLITNV